MRRFVLLVVAGWVSAVAVAACPECIDTNSSACRHWGSGRAFFKWASDEDAGSSITLTAGNSCGVGGGEGGVAYIFAVNDTHRATCKNQVPCDDGLSSKGAVAVIKVTGNQKAYQNIFPGGLTFASDRVVCYDNKCFRDYVTASQIGCEYTLPLASPGNSRIALGVSVSGCDPKFSGGKFNISVKFYEVLGAADVPDRYTLLAATKGSITVRVNNSSDSDAINFKPDLRNGSSIADFKPLYRNYTLEGGQTDWRLKYRGQEWGNNCTSMEGWLSSSGCNNNPMCLVPDEQTFYKVKYPGYGSPVNGNPPYAGQGGWSTTQPNSSLAMLAMNGPDWLVYYLLTSSGLLENTVYMMHYDMGNLGIMYYRGEYYSGDFRRVRQIEYCPQGTNFGHGQILWTFCYDSQNRIQYIHNAIEDPNSSSDPNTPANATAYYYYQYVGTGNDPTVTYWTRPNTQSDWSQQPDRQWELEFDALDRAVKFQGGCTSGCGGSGSFEHIEYYQDYEDLITKQYNATPIQILDNEYEEIEYGHYESAGWIQIINDDFEYPNITAYNCQSQTSFLGWDFTGGNVELCDPNDRGEDSQILRLNNNTIGFGLTQEVNGAVAPEANYILSARIKPQDNHISRFARIELYAVPETGMGVYLTAIDANEANFDPADWEDGVSVEWNSNDRPDLDFGDINNLYHFAIIIRGNYVDIDDLGLSTSLWIGDKPRPVIKKQQKANAQGNLVTTLERQFDENNFQILERQYVSASQCRVIRYDYDDETFTNLVKKTEWQNPATATTLPSDPCFITIYSNDANNITYLPGGRYADNERYDPNSGKIRLSYRRDLENDVNSVREVNTYVNLDTSELSPDWRIKTHTNAGGGVTEYEYESCGTAKLLWKKTDPQTAAGRLVTEFVYDDARRQTEEKKYKRGESNILLSHTVNHYNPVTGFLDWTRDNGNTPDGGYNSAITYYKYNSLGQVIRQTNPDGVKTGNSYGLGGQLVSEFTIAAGWDPNLPDSSLKLISQTRYTYTADGLIEKNGKYKADGTFDYQASVPEPADPNYWVITKYEYYPNGKQKKVIEDFGGANLTTEYFYNLQGEVEKVIYPTGKWVKTTRDGRGLVILEEVGHGTSTVVMETAYDYHADGNLKEQHNPDGTSQFYTYNNFGQLKRVYQQDPNNGFYTEKFYDNAGNVNRELSVDSDGTLLRDIRRRYNAVGNFEMERICAEPNVVDDTADVVTWYKYDVLGNLQYTVQDGPNCSDPNSIADPNNIVTEYIYDGLGRRQQTLSPVGVLSSVFYTSGGLPEQIVDPNNPQDPNADCITWNYYDAAGRLERTVDPEGHYTVNVYNSLNQLTKQTVFDCNETPDNTNNDFAVRQTRTQYDNLGNVIRQVIMKNPASQANPVVGEDMITDYVYDYATGLLYQIKTWYGANPTLAVTTYDYDDIGRKISTVDPEGNEGHIVYSEDTPALVEKTQRLKNNPGGNDYTITTFFDYDVFGRLWKQILDSNGNGDKDYSSDTTTTYLYDGLGRLTNEIAPDEVVTFTDYDGFGNVQWRFEDYYPQNSAHFNKTTEYVYNRLNRLSQIKAYDPNDTTSQVAIQTTTYEYDKAGAVTKITYPDYKFVRYIYNIQNKLDTEIQRNGKWIAYWYDQNRNLIQVSDYDQNDPNWPTGGSATFIETFSYDAAGNLKTADKVEGENSISHSEFTYNGFGLKTSETATYFELQPVTTTWDYDGSGNLIQCSIPMDIGTPGCDLAYTHDGLGRIKTIDRNEERIVNYSYIGTATKAIEYPESQVTQSYSYDELGRIDGVSSVDGQDTTILDFVYDYDNVGNRQSEEYHHLDTPVWDKFYYDNLRRLNQAEYAADSPFAFTVEQPDSGSNRLVYLASLVLQWLDDGSIIATETADNRKENNYNITSVSSVNSEAKVLTLAEFGTSSDPDSKVRTESIYDDKGKLSVQIIYDTNGNITLFAIYLDDSGKVVITSYYDTSGIMTSNICTTYDAHGNVISREEMPLPTETTETTATTEAVIPNPLAGEESVYSATSSFSQADLWLLEADLLYSDGGMMLMSSTPEASEFAFEEFVYDNLGNRYQETTKDGTLFTYSHNADNQYAVRHGLVMGYFEYDEYYSHDDNGNLAMDKDGNIYLYDYRNRLVSIGDGVTTTAEYVYDALGRRIAKTVGDTTTYFYYDTDNRVMTQYAQVQSQDVQPDRTFVYGNGITEVLAMFLPQYDVGEEDFQQFLAFCAAWLSETGDGNYDDDLDLVNDNKIDFKDFAVFAAQWGSFPSNEESHFYYLTDALGSIRGLIGGKFNRQDDKEFYNYDVYGTSSGSSNVGNPFMFAGYMNDPETGHYHLWTRTYDPITGRPLQMDKDYYDSMNLYEYCLSNPMNFIDPWGLACHIWVYFNDKNNPDRKKAGDLFLYGPKGEPLFYAPARGMGWEDYKDDKDRTKPNRNTPLGDYTGQIEGPQPDKIRFGENDVLRLTGKGDYSRQPQIQGELENKRRETASYAGRDGLLIHGGRGDRAIPRKGTTWGVQDGKFVKSPNSNFKCPMGAGGCLRLTDDNQKGLMDALEKYCKCEEIIVHVSPNATPTDPTPLPEWTDPRVPQNKDANSQKPNPI